MAKSSFNVDIEDASGQKYILNTYSRALVKMSDTLHQEYTQGEILSDSAYQALKSAGILVDDKTTQQQQAYQTFEKEQNHNRQLNLVVPLTNACNLGCSYCYQVIHGDFRGEDKIKLKPWNDTSIEALINFVEQQLNNEQFDEVRLRWYGGEPLIRLDLIEKIGLGIKQVCARLGKRLSGMAVTNGTLLKDKALKILKQVNIDRLEISLDGPPQTHNLLRPKALGKGSYDEVLAGILNAAKYIDLIVFRVNLHTKNVEHVEKWLEAIADDIRLPNLYHKYKLVEGDDTNEFGWHDYTKLSERLINKAKSLGLKHLQPNLSTELCPAIRNNYFIVQSDLKLYKCPQNLGSDDNVGVIAEAGDYSLNDTAKHWAEYSVEKDKRCTSCNHLPACNGGCPYNEIMGKINNKSIEQYSREENCCREKSNPNIYLERLL
ncbi:radical SAM protein [Thalassomonas viridans]|uniref:Radical SAM protein n=1 Tax=Thalassomonas viridans TaxID=137584 RepID=A0AAE9Z875_9GAMM|nr:radical SAM protein [Thalassomonas viridans]WDE07865.1 radical SAM protein [Thalassomonas viridans]